MSVSSVLSALRQLGFWQCLDLLVSYSQILNSPWWVEGQWHKNDCHWILWVQDNHQSLLWANEHLLMLGKALVAPMGFPGSVPDILHLLHAGIVLLWKLYVHMDTHTNVLGAQLQCIAFSGMHIRSTSSCVFTYKTHVTVSNVTLCKHYVFNVTMCY